MLEYYRIQSQHGLFRTILPPQHSDNWSTMLTASMCSRQRLRNRPQHSDNWSTMLTLSGFIWILDPRIDLTGQLESLVRQQLFGSVELDLKCAIQRLELDVSLPTADFLQLVDTTFRHGLDFMQSEKPQPPGFSFSRIPEPRWSEVMLQNKIRLLYHRPAGGEPCGLTSPAEETLHAIVEQCLQMDEFAQS